MLDRRGRVRVVAAVAAILSALAVAAVLVFVVLPGAEPVPPPPWRSPAPESATPLLPAVEGAPHGGGAGPGVTVTTKGLARQVSGLLDDPTLGAKTGAVVADGTGGPRYEIAGDLPLTPASTLKLVTGAGVLSAHGPDGRFTTSVVAGRSANDVVLVGGGDPTLTREKSRRGERPDPGQSYRDPARLPDLARATAARLRRDGVSRVRLSVDDSLFAGPDTSPTWPSTYVSGGSVGPVTALSADGGRVDPPSDLRESDPSLAAGRLFADMLESRGVDVAADVVRTSAPPRARTLASERSPRLEEIVESMLAQSDNDMAEMLLRQTAVAVDRPASFAGGARATRGVLTRLGVDLNGLVMNDGSGLSHDDRVDARTLTQVLGLAASPRHPELRPVVTGLPVAGFSGTLDERFSAGSAANAAGLVRAKTGTLTGVSSLAGVAYDREGHVLVFAVLANGVADTFAAEAQLDRVGAALAACGCS